MGVASEASQSALWRRQTRDACECVAARCKCAATLESACSPFAPIAATRDCLLASAVVLNRYLPRLPRGKGGTASVGMTHIDCPTPGTSADPNCFWFQTELRITGRCSQWTCWTSPRKLPRMLPRMLPRISPNDIDQVAVVVDWLDACRRHELGPLLDLYASEASLECDCDGAKQLCGPGCAGIILAAPAGGVLAQCLWTGRDHAVFRRGHARLPELRRQARSHRLHVRRFREDSANPLRPVRAGNGAGCRWCAGSRLVTTRSRSPLQLST